MGRDDEDTPFPEQDVQPVDTPAFDLERISFDDLNAFLVVADNGSFRGAATQLRRSVNTVRAVIDRLEASLGSRIVQRSIHGIRLTEPGKSLRTVAAQMRAAAAQGARESRRLHGSEKTIRMSVSEGLAALWLLPRVIDYQRDNPELTVDFSCDMRSPDILLRDADLAIGLERPTQPDVITARVASLHLMLFASTAYVAERGQPTDLSEWRNHRFVEQVVEGVPHQMLDLFVPAERPPGFITLRTNASSAYCAAVAMGAGIGLLPTYVATIYRNLVPLDIGVNLRRDVWLSYHGDARDSATVQGALAWVRQAFDSAEFPWFAESFVHPDGFNGSGA